LPRSPFFLVLSPVVIAVVNVQAITIRQFDYVVDPVDPI
jgi:hypothetical protein